MLIINLANIKQNWIRKSERSYHEILPYICPEIIRETLFNVELKILK